MNYHNSLFLLEPLCKGIEHAKINSDYLSVFEMSLRFQNIIFFSEKNHFNEISKKHTEKSKLNHFEIDIRLGNNLKFSIANYFTLYNIIKSSKKSKYPLLILSCNSYLLFLIKLILLILNKKAIIILHGFIFELENKKNKEKFFNVSRILNVFNKFIHVRYITLGDFVRTNLIELEPKLEKYVFSINLPFINNHNCISQTVNQNKRYFNGEFVFGSAGVASLSKGSDFFFNLAKDYGHLVNYKFVYIGSFNDNQLELQIKNLNFIEFHNCVSIYEYEKQFSRFDFLVLFYPLKSYRLGFSGVFLDMIVHEKPLIALENDLFRYYFSKYGELGWLFEDYDSLKNHLNNFNLIDYSMDIKHFRDNLKKAKKDFEIQLISKKFDKLFATT